MRAVSFIWLIAAVLLLSAATVWLAQVSGVMALLPAVSAVLLILTVLLRRTR